GERAMPWPDDHKSRTRARIVAAAAAAVRSEGVDRVGVADVMARAGLTHGGFYAHFSSKEDLLTEALEYASDPTPIGLAESLTSPPEGAKLHALVDAYLSPQHAAHPERGCPVAALGPDVARAGGAMQRNFARKIRERLDWIRGLLPHGGRLKGGEEQAIGTLACMVGGL